MSRWDARWQLLVLFFILSACATGYVRHGEYAGYQYGGYGDTLMNANTAVVRFDANRNTPPNLVSSYLLYRCAEVTLQNGFHYFTILSSSRSSENVTLHYKTVRYPIYPPSSSGDNYYTVQQIDSAQWQQTGTNYCRSGACNSPSMVVVIAMFEDGSKAYLPRTYNAYDVTTHYGYLAY